jgi:hypothetical protein
MKLSKYLFAFTLMLAVVACQEDGPEQQQMGADDPEMGAEDPMGQMQQQPDVDTDVSDDELTQFVEASLEARDIEMDSQQEMMAILEDEGIDVQTYNEIAQAREMGQSEDEINASAEDLERFESANNGIEEIGDQIMADMEEAVESKGLAIDRYEEINLALQQDPNLMQRAQQIMQELEGIDPDMQQQPPAEQGPPQDQAPPQQQAPPEP